MCRSAAQGGRRCPSAHPGVRRAQRALSGLLEQVAGQEAGHPADEAYLYAMLWADRALAAAAAGEDERAQRCGWAAQACGQAARRLLADPRAEAGFPSPLLPAPPTPRRPPSARVRAALERRRVPAADLPAIGYAHGTGHDPALSGPQHFRPVGNATAGATKPLGGLWCSPSHDDGTSGWTRFAGDEDLVRERLVVQPVTADPDARIYRIDSHEDLQVFTDAYLRPSPESPGSDKVTVDWPAAADDWDAVHLTKQGRAATHRSGRYNLFGWDVETVLFLRPAYRI